MHIAGFVIPVPEENLEAYRGWAAASARLLRDLGCLEIVEAWEDYVPDGELTDFRRAVDARVEEKIVFTWQVWPSRAVLEAAEKKMQEDSRFDIPADAPFDRSRLILGTFTPLHVMGRGETAGG
ncbi:DUF1428 domain-containing protein [Cribrihabitans neustonicus]|uniref:DUF1428 domain-containing protein n=1 Tax=Cribrihabitans neustonicus TaxID=1429085 RepID=UPI003B5C29E6